MAGKPNSKATTPSFEELFRDLLRIKWPMAPDLPEPAKPAAPVARSCRLDHNTWHNPREGLRIAATIVPMLAELLAAQLLEQRYGVNWWLTAVPAIGALILVDIII